LGLKRKEFTWIEKKNFTWIEKDKSLLGFKNKRVYLDLKGVFKKDYYLGLKRKEFTWI
jgi:hypothetical protein